MRPVFPALFILFTLSSSGWGTDSASKCAEIVAKAFTIPFRFKYMASVCFLTHRWFGQDYQHFVKKFKAPQLSAGILAIGVLKIYRAPGSRKGLRQGSYCV